MTLYENAFISYFDQELPELAFKLKKLAIFDHLSTDLKLDGEFPARHWDARVRISFMKFLKSQGSGLKLLQLSVCFAEDLKRMLKLLPNLECLVVNQFAGDLTRLNLGNNNSITAFATTTVSDQLLNGIIASCSNLKSIFIENLRTHQFFNIVRNANQLKQFCYFWASRTEKVNGNFVNLKRFYERCEKCRLTIDVQEMKKKTFIEMIENKL